MHRQQEVCEFLCHFLERAQPAAFCGRWEARLINPHVCVESGSLLSPLPLEVAGGTISAVIQNWHRQHAVFALESSAGILLLQLKRYNLEDGAARKNMTRIACRPGELVRVPHFRGSQGLEVAMLPYRVAFVIFHPGASTSSGHYQTALSRCCNAASHTGDGEPAARAFYICNDRQRPRLAQVKDQNIIDQNAYVIGLLRSPNPDPDPPPP